MGYLIEAPKEQQIVTAKVNLKSAQLLTPGLIVNIPEYPAVADYFWQVLSINMHIADGTIPYLGTSAIHIQTDGAPNLQYRFGAADIQGLKGVWVFGNIGPTSSTVTQFKVNSRLQIHSPGTLTVGNNQINIYITAILLPI
jgi:hypothetical protein